MNRTYHVSEADYVALEVQGFLRIRGVLRGELVETLYGDVTEVLASGRIGVLAARRLVALSHVHEFVPRLQALIEEGMLHSLASDLMRGQPRLIGSQLIVKPAYCPEQVLWHRDTEYAPTLCSDGLTFWLALNAVTAENGCLWYLAGSHEQRPESPPHTVPEAMLMQGGDLAVHRRNTLHRSGPNSTGLARCALMLEWIPEDRVSG